MADLSVGSRRQAAKQGQAMPDKESGGRFPIRNRAEGAKAIRAVGRVRPNTEEARAKVRRFIVKRLRAIDAADMIPDSWAADGSLK